MFRLPALRIWSRWIQRVLRKAIFASAQDGLLPSRHRRLSLVFSVYSRTNCRYERYQIYQRLIQKLGKSGEGHIWLLFTLLWGQILRGFFRVIGNTLGSRYRNKFRYRDPLFAIPYRNILLIGTNCSDREYTKCLCNVLLIGTILSSDTEYVLLIGTICSDKEYGQPYSLSEQNQTPYRNKLFR